MKLNRRSLEAKALAREVRSARKSNPRKWATHDRYGNKLDHRYVQYFTKPNKYVPHQGAREKARRAA